MNWLDCLNGMALRWCARREPSTIMANRDWTDLFALIITVQRKSPLAHAAPSSKRRGCKIGGESLYDWPYSLVIEATTDPSFFGFYSPDLEGFTGVGHSVEDCLYKAKWGMEEHVTLLREQGLPIPESNPDPTVVIHNERPVEAVV